MELVYELGGHSKTLSIPQEVPHEEVKAEKKKITVVLNHLITNNLTNDEAKEYIKNNLSCGDLLKKVLYKFFKHQCREIIDSRTAAISEKTGVSSNQGVLDIDWDVNIVAGGKGIDKLLKRIASVKITSVQNKYSQSNINSSTTQGSKVSEINFEIDKDSGN